jgi:hypothetical protein
MYLGHLGLALAAKRVRPQLSLGLLAVGAVWLDLVDSALGLLPVPWSAAAGLATHTLPAVLAWTVAAGLAAALILRRDVVSVLVLGGLVLSHVVTDSLTSQLELWVGGPEFGLHLYRFRGLDFGLEAALIAAGWWLYRSTLGERGRQSWPAWLMLGALELLQLVFDFGTRVGA